MIVAAADLLHSETPVASPRSGRGLTAARARRRDLVAFAPASPLAAPLVGYDDDDDEADLDDDELFDDEDDEFEEFEEEEFEEDDEDGLDDEDEFDGDEDDEDEEL